MTTFRVEWTARVDHVFTVDADSEDEARLLAEDEMRPSSVIELIDIEYDIFECEDERGGTSGGS